MYFRRLWNGMFGRVGGQYTTLLAWISRTLSRHLFLCCVTITTVIHANTKHNWQTQIHRRLLCSGTNAFINFWLRFFDTRRETQFLKVFRNYTMLTTSFNGRNLTLCPNGRNSTIVFHGPTSKSQLPGRTSTSHHHGRTPTSTVCHWGRQPNCLPTLPKVNSQQPIFQNLQILKTIASEHDVIPTSASFPIWDLLWQLWLLYPLRVSVKP